MIEPGSLQRVSWIAATILAISWAPAGATEPAITNDHVIQIAKIVEELYGPLLARYEDLHSNPELSLHEVRTASKLAAELRDAGCDVTPGVGGNGVVAIMNNGPGRTVMVRCDLDALPIKERTGLGYASTATAIDDSGQKVNVMHACGHDIHMTTVIGVARVMARMKDAWSGTLMLIGQPAEERGLGAKSMLDDGLFIRFPKPDYALALHVDATLEAGKVSCCEGYALANVDSVDIIVRGRGGHGAAPHATIDPILLACRTVVALQTIVSREINPLDDAVVTVGSIHGGTKHNIIPDEVRLQLTVRSYKDEVRRHLHDAIRRITFSLAESAGAPKPTVLVSEGTPATYNDPTLVARCMPVFELVLGKHQVATGEPVMAGEDFSRYGRSGVPAIMYRLGAVEPGRLDEGKQANGEGLPSLHSPLFAPPPELTIKTGVRTMSAAVLNLLVKPNHANSGR